MNAEKFSDGSRAKVAADIYVDRASGKPDRRKLSAPVVAPQLTIAQCIRRSKDPRKAAIASFSRRVCPHDSSRHTYYFEDGSFLVFDVIFMPVEDGGRG